jgi:hypothetical protein
VGHAQPPQPPCLPCAKRRECPMRRGGMRQIARRSGKLGLCVGVGLQRESVVARHGAEPLLRIAGESRKAAPGVQRLDRRPEIAFFVRGRRIVNFDCPYPHAGLQNRNRLRMRPFFQRSTPHRRNRFSGQHLFYVARQRPDVTAREGGGKTNDGVITFSRSRGIALRPSGPRVQRFARCEP